MLGESIALEKSSQSSFSKAVKGIQRIIKNETNNEAHVFSPKLKRKQPTRIDPKPKDRGVVYLTHVPHGFYEDAIKGYFSQFGEISAVKLVRSKKTGKSRGFAFIEFLHTEVAKVAAETMNNYLMFNRLLKAEYIPPDKQKRFLFNRGDQSKRITPENCTSTISRIKYIKKKNKTLTAMQEQRSKTASLKKLASVKSKLNNLGIAYNLQPAKQNTAIFEKDHGVNESLPVLILDETDEDFSFKVPRGAIVKSLNRGIILPKSQKTTKKVISPEKRAVKATIPSLQKLSLRTAGGLVKEKAGPKKAKKVDQKRKHSLDKEKQVSIATLKEGAKKKEPAVSKVNMEAMKVVVSNSELKPKGKGDKKKREEKSSKLAVPHKLVINSKSPYITPEEKALQRKINKLVSDTIPKSKKPTKKLSKTAISTLQQHPKKKGITSIKVGSGIKKVKGSIAELKLKGKKSVKQLKSVELPSSSKDLAADPPGTESSFSMRLPKDQKSKILKKAK